MHEKWTHRPTSNMLKKNPFSIARPKGEKMIRMYMRAKCVDGGCVSGWVGAFLKQNTISKAEKL